MLLYFERKQSLKLPFDIDNFVWNTYILCMMTMVDIMVIIWMMDLMTWMKFWPTGMMEYQSLCFVEDAVTFRTVPVTCSGGILDGGILE